MAKMCMVSRLERQFATLYLFHAPTPPPAHKKTSTKEVCDTIATNIARYEKYRCWASKPPSLLMICQSGCCQQVANTVYAFARFLGVLAGIRAMHMASAFNQIRLPSIQTR